MMNENFIHIIGTLLGVLTGWFLGLLSTAGIVRFHFSNCKIHFYERDKGGSFFSKELNEKSEYGKFSFEVDISNTSRNGKLLREINASIEIDDNIFIKDILDLNTSRMVGNQRIIDSLNIFNIPPQGIMRLHLYIHFDKNDLLNMMDQKTDVYFSYKQLWGFRRNKRLYIISLPIGKIYNMVETLMII
jgi:hypothetical protein